MKKGNKSGFTIIELILTTIIMAVVCVIAPVIIVKRAAKPHKAGNYNNISECTGKKCIFDFATTTTISLDDEGKQKISTSYDYNKNSNEFYTIELIGGGGGGTNKSFGYPGEHKKIVLPSLGKNNVITNQTITDGEGKYKGILTGFYLLEPGEGKTGEEGSIGSGKPSRICIITEEEAKGDIKSLSCSNGNRIIIAEAKGGITSHETDEDIIQAVTSDAINQMCEDISDTDKLAACKCRNIKYSKSPRKPAYDGGYGWGARKLNGTPDTKCEKYFNNRGIIIIK